MLNTSPEAVLCRRQIAYDNLKKQMEERQKDVNMFRNCSMAFTRELENEKPDQKRQEWIKQKQSEVLLLIAEENAQIVRIAKDLCILEDRGCR